MNNRHQEEQEVLSSAWVWNNLFGDNIPKEESSSCKFYGTNVAARRHATSSNDTTDATAPTTEETRLLTGTHCGSNDGLLIGYMGSMSTRNSFVETTHTVREKLMELQAELDRYPIQSLTTYQYVRQKQQQQQQQQQTNEQNLIQMTISSKKEDFLTNLQVQILGSEEWIVSKAARRLLHYLDAKLQWFGRETLSMSLIDIVQTTNTTTTLTSKFDSKSVFRSDLSHRYLWSGIFQVLEANETRKGRPILMIFPSLLWSKETENDTTLSLFDMVKAWWYFVAIVVETVNRSHPGRKDFAGIIFDVTPSSKNCVNVRDRDYPLHTSGSEMSQDKSSKMTKDEKDLRLLYWYGLCSLQQLPLSIQEWHYCHDDSSALSSLLVPSWTYDSLSLSIAKLFFQGTESTPPPTTSSSSSQRGRLIHFHQGSQTECLYALMHHGIPSGDFPLSTTDGSINVARHHAWLRKHLSRSTN